MRVPLGMPRDSWAAARSAAAEMRSCSPAVRRGAVERAVVQAVRAAAHNRVAARIKRFGMGPFMTAAPAAGNFHYPADCCNTVRPLWQTARAKKQTPPANYLRGLFIFLSDIRPDSRYGLSPIVPFSIVG